MLYRVQFEIVKRFIFKKLFKLPKITPNYMLGTEAQLTDLHIFTFNVHYSYINKTLNMCSNRFLAIISNYRVEKEILWYVIWKKIFNSHNLSLPDFNDIMELRNIQNAILSSEIERRFNAHCSKARNGTHHDIYPILTLINQK